MVIDMELEDAKKSVLELMKEKENIEIKLQEHKMVLTTNNVDMDDPLVDSDGYPRSDIDVYQVRHARHKIICLQNDYKSIMKKIDDGLAIVHSIAGNDNVERITNRIPSNSSSSDDDLTCEPFLRVNLVSSGSPAEHAGIHENDLIMEFGSINFQNFRDLKDIGELVEQSRYKSIDVKVKRMNKKIITLSLTPRPWSGRGLLGCNVIPLESVER